jgi:hypothetical protein
MSSESNGAQDPAPAMVAATTGSVVTSSAMQLFAPDPNAVGENVSFSYPFYLFRSLHYRPQIPPGTT